MPFKIVQTIEDSRLCLSIVPSRWEENGKLFWPKSRMSIRKLIKVENSKPEKGKWDELPCVKKREFATLAEAEEEMSHMEEDSETEKDTLPEHLRSRKRQALKPISPLLDLNDLMTENAIEAAHHHSSTSYELPYKPNKITNDQINTMHIIQSEAEIEQANDFEMEHTNSKKVLFLHKGKQCIASVSRENSGNLNINESPVNLQEDIFVLDNEHVESEQYSLEMVIENQKKIFDKMARLQTCLESLVKLISENLTFINHEGNQPVEKEIINFSPIDTKEKLEWFEEELKNKKFFDDFVQKMSIICGKTGKENGLDVCYKLIDYFIDRNFLRMCSWTGNTRARDEQSSKVAVKYCKNFRNCFLTVVRLADVDFSEQNCEIFLKRVLKNSTQRSTAKRILSTHKKRPKKISYLRGSQKEIEVERKYYNGGAEVVPDNEYFEVETIILQDEDNESEDN